MATHSCILAWTVPWTEEPGGLQSTGSQSQTRLSDFTLTSLIKFIISFKCQFYIYVTVILCYYGIYIYMYATELL